MQKDLKIGMAAGLAIAAVAGLWLCTRPSLSVRERMSPDTDRPVEFDGPPRYTTNLPGVEPLQTRQNGSAADNTNNEPSTRRDYSDLTIYEQPEKIRTQKFHIVRNGETLSHIAQEYYGSSRKLRKIIDANKDVMTNPNRLTPGTKLIIPD